MSLKSLLGRRRSQEQRQQSTKFFSRAHLLSLFRSRSHDCPADRLPALLDVPTSKRPLLFILKLALCSVVFDFADPWQDSDEKEMKTQTLLELAEYFSAKKAIKKLDKEALQATFSMLSTNLFRTLPAPAHGASDGEEEQPVQDPSWPHLQLVYDLLLVFLNHPRAVKYADNAFILRFLDLFESADPRERDYLKKALHRLYGRSMRHRLFLRKAIRTMFQRVSLDTEKHNGIAEILDILHSIIHGFIVPLKEEHKLFLLEALIPLHKTTWLWVYHKSLVPCTVNFIEKDPKLAGAVIRGLLDFWPVTDSRNEVLILEELGHILEATQLGDFQSCMVPLFQQISQSLMSSHMEVVVEALKLWTNEHVASMIAQNRCVILPFIIGAIERLCNRSGDESGVREQAESVRKMFQDLDARQFEESLKGYHDRLKVESGFAANVSTAKLVVVK